MIEILHAPPLLTVQDLGRRTCCHTGVPIGGAMDRHAAAIANAVVGNAADRAVLESAAGAFECRLHASALLAITGGIEGSASTGHSIPRGTAVALPAGASLRLTPMRGARFGYVAVRGGIGTDPVLGSRATYPPAGIGGYRGRALRAGDFLPVDPPVSPAPRQGFSWPPGEAPVPPLVVRFIPGPEWEALDRSGQERFQQERWTLSTQSDRAGSRLDGFLLPLHHPADVPSRGMVPGTIELPLGGTPIVLMRDGPTVGGYARIGAVIAVDLDRLAQAPAGATVQFEVIEREAAVDRYREQQREWQDALACALASAETGA